MNWRDNAACIGLDTEAFFPERGESTRPAVAVCQDCPVQAECLDYALRNELDGMWGGQSQRSLRKMRQQLGIRVSRPESAVLGLHAACGTDGGYNRHYRAGTPACLECKAAHVAANQGRRAAC